MPLGESLGDAYVRVHADTSLMKQEIERAATKMGGPAGEAFGDEFFKSVQKQIRARNKSAFKIGFVTGNFEPFIKQFSSVDEALESARLRLERMGDEGGLSAKKLAKLQEVLSKAFDARALNELDRALIDQNRAWTTYGKNVEFTLTKQQRLIDEQEKAWATYGRNVAFSLEHGTQAMRDQEKAWESYGRNIEATNTRVRKGFESITDVWSQLENRARSIAKVKGGGFTVVEEHEIERVGRMARALQTLELWVSRSGNVFGRAFGKGSRNDFLNFTGSVIGGVTQVVIAVTEMGVKLATHAGPALVKLGEAFLHPVESIQKLITLIQDNAGNIGALLAAGSKVGITALAALAAASVGVITGIGLLGEALAILTAIASNAAGAIVIAAGALGVGLVGAIGPAIPLVAALAAGITTLVIAFSNMSEKTKGIFKPLQDGFTKIAKAMSDVFFRDAPKWVGSLTNLLTTFAGPTMTKIASNIRDSITQILKDFETAPMKKALKSWEDALGPIAGTLTDAIGKAIQGLTAFFVPLLPIAQQFADLLETIATNFSNWAQSAQGQNSIATFFNTAWERAQQLFSIIGQITGILGTLLRSGDSAAGKQFLGWLDEKLGQLRAFLDSAEGQNKLAEWFKQAQKFADLVWKAIEKVGEALGKLNTPQAQEFASKLIIAFGRLAEVIGNLAPVFDFVGKVAGFFLAGVSKALGSMLSTFGLVIGGLATVLHAIPDFIPGSGAMHELATELDGVAVSAGVAGAELSGLPDQIQIDFDATDTDLILAAQNAEGIVNAQDGSTATTYFDGDIAKLKTSAGDANALLTGGPPGAPPSSFSTQFEGSITQLVKDAAGATAIISNYNQEAVATTTFTGDTSALLDATVDAEGIVKRVKPTYETEFGGDTALLQDATVDANKIIEGVQPEWLTNFLGNADPINTAAIQATGTIVDVPIDWTTFFAGDPGPLTKAAAAANDEIIKVQQDWNTVFDGDTGALMDATIDANAAINQVIPNFDTRFGGDTSALLDSTEAANQYINGVHDEHSTEFGGDTSALLDATIVGQGYIGEVPPEWLTNFLGDNGPLNKEAIGAAAIINGVADSNLTTFNGNNQPLNSAAGDANRFIDRVYDSNLTTFNGNASDVQSKAGQATAAVNSVPDYNTTTLTVDMSGFIASVRYAKSLLNDLGQARVNAAGRAAGAIVGAQAGTILSGPRVVLAGEAGPEAIVPLRRPLNQVDPSVRALSAIAQGMGMPTIEPGAIVINTPTKSPERVAEKVLDAIVLGLG